MLYMFLEIVHIAPLVAMSLYTLFLISAYMKTGKLSIIENYAPVAGLMSTIGMAGHFLQPAHAHMSEPCIAYSVIIAFSAYKIATTLLSSKKI